MEEYSEPLTPWKRAQRIQAQEEHRRGIELASAQQGAKNLEALAHDLDELTRHYGWSVSLDYEPEMHVTVNIDGKPFVAWHRDGETLLGDFHSDPKTTSPHTAETAFDATVLRFLQVRDWHKGH